MGAWGTPGSRGTPAYPAHLTQLGGNLVAGPLFWRLPRDDVRIEHVQAFLEDRVAQFRDETGLTGVAAAVMIDGQSAGAAASGERLRGSGIPVTVDDRWHVGSITKSMTALLLAVLEDNGAVVPARHVACTVAQCRNGRWLAQLCAAPPTDTRSGRTRELSKQGAKRLA